jgi:hypothetical protein
MENEIEEGMRQVFSRLFRLFHTQALHMPVVSLVIYEVVSRSFRTESITKIYAYNNKH